MDGDTPQRYVLGVAYQAGPDPRIVTGADGSRDCFTPEELERAAWAFMQGPRDIGLFHEDGTEGHADVVESYIYRGPDWDLGDGVVIRAGDWLIGCILDGPAWALYQSGDITGFSPQGQAKRRQRSTE
ncbi:hypothetical protein SCMU_13930 [Sinomonas cyclohexanicum]|uniref:Phage-like element PBSX protein XkdF domain-containing protein n=1 Tax=Sinomonas cyclohexanicum TaxID=322009 RepID=A0ABM7PTI0_SINCY|nr:XkdF-like putative serine protease domain-containing protein [Corynebacterium cyclohexanicum]BCT75551.1 hypothetical protein SCMU_13930 [Corynebacterium cyclohexanicum]